MLRAWTPKLRAHAAVLGFFIVTAVLGTRLLHKLNVVGALTLPFTALLVNRIAEEWGAGPRLRWALVSLLAALALNYLASLTGVAIVGISGFWWTVITSLNSVVLMTGLRLFVTRAFREPRMAAPDAAGSPSI
jgi:hypothetical protein